MSFCTCLQLTVNIRYLTVAVSAVGYHEGHATEVASAIWTSLCMGLPQFEHSSVHLLQRRTGTSSMCKLLAVPQHIDPFDEDRTCLRNVGFPFENNAVDIPKTFTEFVHRTHFKFYRCCLCSSTPPHVLCPEVLYRFQLHLASGVCGRSTR
jgi:hypothetical protein